MGTTGNGEHKVPAENQKLFKSFVVKPEELFLPACE